MTSEKIPEIYWPSFEIIAKLVRRMDAQLNPAVLKPSKPNYIRSIQQSSTRHATYMKEMNERPCSSLTILWMTPQGHSQTLRVYHIKWRSSERRKADDLISYIYRLFVIYIRYIRCDSCVWSRNNKLQTDKIDDYRKLYGIDMGKSSALWSCLWRSRFERSFYRRDAWFCLVLNEKLFGRL